MHRDKNYVCHLTTVHVRTDVRVFYKECVSLSNAGYRVRIIVADGKGNEYKSGVTIHDIGNFPNRLKRMLLAPLKLYVKAIAQPAYIYHIHDPELLPIGLLLKLTTKAKIIYDIHESYPSLFLHKEYLTPLLGRIISSAFKHLELFSLSVFDTGLCATPTIAAQFLAVKTPVMVLYNFPLLREWKFISRHEQKSHRDICYVGNITKERGLTAVIKAIEDVNCTLHLAGTYEPASYRDELVKIPGFSKVIEYGYLNRAQVTDLISKCIVGIVLLQKKPNYLDSLATKVFEYMAGATCVMVSNFPIYIDTIQQQDCGVCVDPENVRVIANALSMLLADPERTICMGTNGRRLVHEKYSWESQETTLLDAYSQLIGQ